MTSYRENPKDFSEFDYIAAQLHEKFKRLCDKQRQLKSTDLYCEYVSFGNSNETKSYYYRLSSMGPMSNWITKINFISTVYFWLYFKFNHEDEIYYTLTTDLGLDQFKRCVDRMLNCIEQVENQKFIFNHYPLTIIEDRYTKPIYSKSNKYYIQHYLSRHGFDRPHFSKLQNIPAVPKDSFL